MNIADQQKPGRVARRRQRNHETLIKAGQDVMAEKGIDAATMQEIADRADLGAGTVYSYFKSKDDLAIAVLERLMHDLATRIEKVTDTFGDPGQVYAYGVYKVIETATGDLRWKQLLSRSEVIADAMYRQMGPFAIRDLENATRAGRFRVEDAMLTFKMATYAIVGVALAVTTGQMPDSVIDESIVGILCMTGIGRDEAIELASRERPPLPA
ncbi:MAG: helix-turn-helix domain containing protein [Rhizobiaceae bacterium]|nr:helix-turn-helix domain containing protein [Rhizobiaceae bacterium]